MVCLSAEGVKYVSWSWKPSLQAWSSLNKTFPGNFIYVCISIYTYLYTYIQICIHRGTWTYNTWRSNVYRGTIKLKHLVQKLIRYQDHHLNYKGSLENGLVKGLKRLKINKRPAIKLVTVGFFEKWHTILLDAENGLVQLLLSESLKVVKKLDEELDSEYKEIRPNIFKEKQIQFENKYENYKKKQEFRRICKWKKFEEKQVILEQEKVKSNNVNGTVQSSITESNPTNNKNRKTH